MEDILDIEAIAEVDIEVENEVDIEVEVEQAGPQGKDGKSAYEIYVDNGGELSEVEWLESLKGTQGEPGKDGYTPVKGEDYWTVEEQQAIKTDLETYINEQLGVIENGSY